jgi:protoporphyrin/coproporphyrin ferrochelatase
MSETATRPSRDGLLLVNLGTPKAPTKFQVGKYLAEFLSDPRVIDIPAVARKLLLSFVILPFRTPKSAAAYRSIWMRAGSPLLVHSKRLLGAVRALDQDLAAALAMRYGSPSIRRGIDHLIESGCDHIVVMPLYPQFAESSTGSTMAQVEHEIRRMNPKPRISFVPAFYDDPGFIEAFAGVARREFESFRPDHVLFSFHGLPERHVKRTDPTGRHCLATANCCDAIVAANRNCYRAQCFATARALTTALGLDAANTTIAFQSRLGRTPWIQPYTDIVLDELAAKGVKRLAVMCPAFVADCLETLEEIGIRAKEQFARHGGELLLVPSLNSSTVWAGAVLSIARRAGLAPTAAVP